MATGTATIDFGAFPGKSDTSLAITGQTAIVAGSLVEAWLRPVATADHTVDEHMLETIKVFAADIVAGTGFTIYAFNTSELNEPDPDPNKLPFGIVHSSNVNARWDALAADGAFGRGSGEGSKGTRIYGQFTVAWAWV